MTNIVFIATSIDGYIADKNNKLGWLEDIPKAIELPNLPDETGAGYFPLLARVDALVMGRNTFDAVYNMDVDWPYTKPVIVLSHSMTDVPNGYKDKIKIMSGPVVDVLAELNRQGFNNLYIDGGRNIQSFLKEDLIDELIITTIPTLLGGGAPLFGDIENRLNFRLTQSQVFEGSMVQSHFVRLR